MARRQRTTATSSLINGFLAIVFSAGTIGTLSGLGLFSCAAATRSDGTYTWHEIALDLRIFASFLLGALVCDAFPLMSRKESEDVREEEQNSSEPPDDDVCVSQLNFVLL
eukprot:TRINITY_DN22121_c0_g1_i1.p3 TRINITY_DN22121_c0_g1~~TRINITY_DN22121_c0_g1_i1.p3  ORF type:complete len:110 (+),score=22.71 TRINITY_DN22121_c0_g1_i1:157-486(+)